MAGKTKNEILSLKADDTINLLKKLEETEVTGEVVGVPKVAGKHAAPTPFEGRYLCFPGMLSKMPRDYLQQRLQRVQEESSPCHVATHAHAHALAYVQALAPNVAVPAQLPVVASLPPPQPPYAHGVQMHAHAVQMQMQPQSQVCRNVYLLQ